MIAAVHPATRWLSWDLAAVMGALAARGVDLTAADSWLAADN